MTATDRQELLPFDAPEPRDYGPAVCPDCGAPVIVVDPRLMAGQRMLAGFRDRLVVNATDYMPHPCAYPADGERLPGKGTA